MSEFTTSAKIELSVTMTVTESEARALEALIGYGTDAFLRVFYKEMGEAYMKPHEAGLRLLFSSVSRSIPNALQRVDAARKVFKGTPE